MTDFIVNDSPESRDAVHAAVADLGDAGKRALDVERANVAHWKRRARAAEAKAKAAERIAGGEPEYQRVVVVNDTLPAIVTLLREIRDLLAEGA